MPDGPPDAPSSTAHDAATRRGFRWLAAFAAVGLLQVAFLAIVEIDRTVRHRQAIAALEADLAAARAEVEALRAIADRADDEGFREGLARRQGFMDPDEARIVILDPTTALRRPTASASDAASDPDGSTAPSEPADPPDAP